MPTQNSGESEVWSGASEWEPGGSLKKANQVDDWIAIGTEGIITVFSGKVELGQGVRTALAQIVADELDVSFERIRMVMGDTARTPDEGFTAGSTTIRLGGFALRHASAEARAALLELASERLDAAVDELVVRDGVVSVSHHPECTITYTELMGGKKFNRKIMGRAPLKKPADYRVVGQPIQRVDIPRKVTGAAIYIQDVRVPGMLHARVVRPPSPGAKFVSMDASAAQNARVVRLGNFIGVVAEREEDAVNAAKQLKVKWRATARLPSMENFAKYIQQQSTQDEIVVAEGKVDAALRRAVKRIKATYYQPFQAHASIGPACAVADAQSDRAIIWSNSQGVFAVRDALADLLEMSPEKIQVIHVEGAGSYGHNGSDDVTADAAILSREVGKPVRVQWSREDELAWEPYTPAMVMQVRGGVDKYGNVVAWSYEVWTPSHVTRARNKSGLIAGQLIFGKPAPPPPWFGGGTRNAPTNYTFPHQRVTAHWLKRLPLRTSAMRALGGTANTFANESFMDELANAAKIDPLEFRLRHLTDPRAHAVLKAAAERAGWGDSLSKDEGRGIAYAQYENDEAYVAMVAHVHVNRQSGEVRVTRIVVAHDCGLIINPDGLKNQIEGNVIQATSRALKEQVTWDSAASRITSVDWEAYPILKFSEVPEIEVALINHPDQPAVGAGEPSTIVAAAAIANAIFAATGARVREIPFTPRRIKAVLAEKVTTRRTRAKRRTK